MKFFETERNDEWIVEGDRYDNVSVSFAIRSDDLSLESVSKNLGLSCTRGFERGDVFFSGRNHDRCEKLWGAWVYESEHHVFSDKLKDHLDFMLSVFEPKMEQLKPYLGDEAYTVRFDMSFYETLSVASCELDKETMTRILNLCNSIGVCLVTDDRDLSEDD
ncbi:MAG: DUF4279 domain-containing protein [Planctomycetaceae bacterium]|nr:DUF4279 domain-containing protein [Planctomycetaceae bacterium]